jgi:hypothetical protein
MGESEKQPSLQNLLPGKPSRGKGRTKYVELKQRCSLSLTPTAIALLDKKAERAGLSRSEYVEQVARADE